MSVLVVAEKPSVGMSLAAVLGARNRKDGYVEGNGYIVSWCVGHLVGLADAYEYNEQYGKWRREDLPIMPEEWKHIIFDGKKKQFNILRGLMNRKDVDTIINACDSGREGELIFRFVYQMAGCSKPFSRLWISSMEESAIKAGFANLKDGREYDPLYYSAICRAKADWLIGINATRLFSTLYGKTLNVGRVQTPTLAMLADRQQKISSFVKEKYHKVRLKMDGIEASSGQIKDQQEAEQMQTACHNRQAVCHSLTKETKTVSPPKLFDLTALQRESNLLFGYTAQQTLNAAQKLYEAKLITYPRTDSRYITTDMAAGISALMQSASAFIGTPTHDPINTGLIVNDAEVSDHHAIIPTAGICRGLEKTKAPNIADVEYNILSLVAVRLLCAVASKHIYEAITAVFDCNGHSFTAKGKVIIADGWKSVLGGYLSKMNLVNPVSDGFEYGGELPPIIEGQTFENAGATVTDHFTQSPKPYSEASLLSAMENAGRDDITEEVERRGLGTPATRAAVIEKLVNGGFITRSGRQLTPTPDGENLIKILPSQLKSPELTAIWESALAEMALGEMNPENFMREVEEMTRALVNQNAAPVEEYKDIFGGPKEAIGTCPRCSNNVIENKKTFHCENRDCKFVMWKADLFFTRRRKEFTKDLAIELLKHGKAKVTGFYSEKKNKTYDAIVLLASGGEGYPRYKMEFETR